MSVQRPLFLALSWILLFALVTRLVGDLTPFAHPVAALYVLLLPWLAAMIPHGPREALGALRDAFDTSPGDIPVARRLVSTAVLRTVAGTSVAAGILALIAAMVQVFSIVTATSGSAHPAELFQGISVGLLAPLYGVALRSFLYEPLAASLERPDAQGFTEP